MCKSANIPTIIIFSKQFESAALKTINVPNASAANRTKTILLFFRNLES